MYQYPYPQRPGAAGPPPPVPAPAGPAPLPYGQLGAVPSYGAPPPPPQLQPVATPALYSVSSGSVTTLRLKPADEIKIEPPVPVSAALVPSTSTSSPPTLDLSLERQLVGASTSSSTAKEFVASATDDTFLDAAVRQTAASASVSPAVAALGVAYSKLVRGGPDKAADFSSHVAQLTGMGFSLALSAGALVKHNDDVEAATESCLAAS